MPQGQKAMLTIQCVSAFSQSVHLQNLQVANNLQSAASVVPEHAAAGPQTASIHNKTLAEVQEQMHISQQQVCTYFSRSGSVGLYLYCRAERCEWHTLVSLRKQARLKLQATLNARSVQSDGDSMYQLS